jgi:hypothetical protein
MNKFLIVYSFEAIHLITDIKEIDKKIFLSILKDEHYQVSDQIITAVMTATNNRRKVIILSTDQSINDLHTLHSTNYHEFVETMNTGNILN